MKIIHISAMRDLSAGIRQQLLYESECAKLIPDAQWDIVALHDGAPKCAFERQVPFIFRIVFLRNLWAWLLAIRLSRSYDFVLLRHLTFDPFALVFSFFIKNRISIHHSKEIEELRQVRAGIIGVLASRLEVISGRNSIENACGIIGVTPEICQYELSRIELSKPVCFYPNGISYTGVSPVSDLRNGSVVSAVFICAKFASWHGLDLLLEAAKLANESNSGRKLHVHLIGELSELQARDVKAASGKVVDFTIHGQMEKTEYHEVLAKCDLAFGSFALYRKNMEQAATLKVREMLAMGLPVYSGHQDAALPEHFEYYCRCDRVDVGEIFEKADTWSKHSRQDVSAGAQKYIDKITLMRIVISWLSSIKN